MLDWLKQRELPYSEELIRTPCDHGPSADKMREEEARNELSMAGRIC